MFALSRRLETVQKISLGSKEKKIKQSYIHVASERYTPNKNEGPNKQINKHSKPHFELANA